MDSRSHSSDSDLDEDWDNRMLQNLDNRIGHHNCLSPWNKEHEGVSTLYRCEASEARSLYIFDSAYKLQDSDQYDIGGAYIGNDEGLWFFFTTSLMPGRSYLMSIFVCQRKPGVFSLGISDSQNLISKIYNDENVIALSNVLKWQNFNSTKPDQVHHIKTFNFSEEDRFLLTKMVLVIPISINLNPKSVLNQEVVQKIKAEHDFGEKLFKDIEPDFVIMSSEGKEFKTHKIVLAGHSSVIREMIRTNDCEPLYINLTNNETELLLQYLYTGMIEDILNQQLETLLKIAHKFKLDNLLEIVKHAIKLTICSDNALNMAVMAEQYNCKDVQEVAFKYIANHPEVLDTVAFSQINNTDLIKKLLRYVHVKTSVN